MASTNTSITNRQKRKAAYRARHRLLSINRDALLLADQQLAPPITNSGTWPWIPNKQCGSWYLPETTDITPVYFKSTDGHVGTYNFSLKRLNLHLLQVLHECGGCYLIDCSVRKVLPDSFSRTIPIWCCVMNRIVQKYRNEMNMSCERSWNIHLYTPGSIVSTEEHALISNLIDSRVQLLYESKAIVDPKGLMQLMDRPLKACWYTNGKLEQCSHFNEDTSESVRDDDFYTIVCYNPSSYEEDSKNHIRWINADKTDGFYYTPGAADDDATWGRGLTHQLFWLNKERLLKRSLDEGDVDALIDTIVTHDLDRATGISPNKNSNDTACCMDKIGNLNLWIGSRKSGRPPTCWEHFDAILNVSEMEYPTMYDSINHEKQCSHKPRFYLMLPVAEGKKDKYELEKWMPVGLYFLTQHLQQEGRRVLVHCAQGKDRSVALVLGLVALGCPLEYPLRLRQDFGAFDLDILGRLAKKSAHEDIHEDCKYLKSGLTDFVVKELLADNGRDLFLTWAHQYSSSLTPLANKHSLRIGKVSNECSSSFDCLSS